MFIIKKENNNINSLLAKEIKLKDLSSFNSELAKKIINAVKEKSMYPLQIAKKLKVHEQKIYYHIRNLEKAGIIKITKKETKKGAVANYYKLTNPAFIIRFSEFEKTQKIGSIRNESEFLKPFIENGKLNALIIVGSPDPHGPDKARSRDGYYGMDLALFLGTFLNYIPEFNVKLDTEVREKDLTKNLILIGGPKVNKTVEKFNTKLPVRFQDGKIYSTISGKTYPQEECGVIIKQKNHLNKNKSILIVAGKSAPGTKAAIIAFLKNFKKVKSGNAHNNKIDAKVVEGIDLDSDGIVDDIEFRE